MTKNTEENTGLLEFYRYNKIAMNAAKLLILTTAVYVCYKS